MKTFRTKFTVVLICLAVATFGYIAISSSIYGRQYATGILISESLNKSNVSSVLRLGKVYTKEEPTPLSKRSPSNFSAIIAPNSGSPSASHDNLTHHELEGQSIQDQLCVRYNTSEAACREVQSRPPDVPHTVYPIQFVSGAPGSGNDWILWLGAVHGYEQTQEYLLSHCETYHIERDRRPDSIFPKLPSGSKDNDKQPLDTMSTHCPYIKTHEPWFKSPSDWKYFKLAEADRTALVLRHPFDSALSEYKRRSVIRALSGADKKTLAGAKSRTDGLSLDLFFNTSTTEEHTWSKYYPHHIKKWVSHAKYWLEEWKRPIRVLIYKDFARNVRHELVHMLDFFGYTLDSNNAERHCCVLHNPINKKIQRKTSVIDPYKERLLEGDATLRQLCDDAVTQIHSLLDKRWPGVYRIKRG